MDSANTAFKHFRASWFGLDYLPFNSLFRAILYRSLSRKLLKCLPLVATKNDHHTIVHRCFIGYILSFGIYSKKTNPTF